MIKHHPTDEILSQFVSADLPASLSVAVAIHVDMCPCCKSKVAAIEAKNAEQVFAEESINDFLVEDELEGISDLLDAITMDESVDDMYEVEPQLISINQQDYQFVFHYHYHEQEDRNLLLGFAYCTLSCNHQYFYQQKELSSSCS